MNGRYDLQEQVPSSSGHGTYTVSRIAAGLQNGGQWECSCIGWTRTVPRRDCKHIRQAKSHAGLTPPAPAGAQVLKPWAPVGTPRSAKTDLSNLAGAARRTMAKGNLSVYQGVTPRTVEEQASDAARVKREGVAAKKLSALRQLRFGFQLAHPYDPSKDDISKGSWVAEIKYDGILAMLIDGHLINRSGNDITHRFPEIDAGAWDNLVLVGEMCVIENGLSVFQRIQERATDDSIAIKALSKQHPAQFMAFDLLELNGTVFDRENALVRRVRLEQWFHDFGEDARVDGFELVEQLKVESDTEVQTLVEQCRKMETEGVVLKDTSQPYVAARGRNWVKAKSWLEEEFEVVRYEDTGVGGGWVFYVQSGNHEQRIVCNSAAMKKTIIKNMESPSNGHQRVEVKYLSKSEDGALRFPSLRRLV